MRRFGTSMAAGLPFTATDGSPRSRFDCREKGVPHMQTSNFLHRLPTSVSAGKAARIPFVAILAGLLGMTAGAAPALAQQEPSGLQLLLALEDSLVKAIEKNQKSIVSIARVRGEDDRIFRDERGFLQETQPPQPTDPDFVPNEFATGVVVAQNGLVLTNYHVLGDVEEGRNAYWVTTSDRKVYAARIKAADPRHDLAVLQIDARDLTPIRFGDGEKIRQGQIVIALGNPYAIARDGQCSASWGIVANLLRKAPPEVSDTASGKKPTLHHYGTLIQTDAHLNLGSSGGALLNLKGEMIGLTTSLAALSGYERTAGYAIPVDETFRRLVEALKQGREAEFGFLGVAPVNLDVDQVRRGVRGALVSRVEAGTPADEAGLRSGDIITAVDGADVFDADSLVLSVGRRDVEERVTLTYLRAGRSHTADVTLSKFPVPGKKVFTPRPLWRGIRVEFTSVLSRANLAQEFDPALLDGCVAIIEVERDSPAWELGLRPGVLITKVDGQRVRTPGEFRALTDDNDSEVRLSLAGSTRPAAEVRVPHKSSGS